MTEIKIKDKQKYFDENQLGGELKLTDMMQCLHCGNVITVGDFKVFKNETGFEFICCPNAPDCNGTIIDWLPLDYTFE